MKTLQRTLFAAALVTVPVTACGNRNDSQQQAVPEPTATETTLPVGTTAKNPGKEAFCATVVENLELLRHTDPDSSGTAIDEFVVVVQELAQLAPDEVSEDARALADAVQPIADAPEADKGRLLSEASDDEEVKASADRFADYVDDECNVSLSGETTGTTLSPSPDATAPGTTDDPQAEDDDAMSVKKLKQWMADNERDERWYSDINGWGVFELGGSWVLNVDLGGSPSTEDAIGLCNALKRYAVETVGQSADVTIEVNGPGGVELVRADGLDMACDES